MYIIESNRIRSAKHPSQINVCLVGMDDTCVWMCARIDMCHGVLNSAKENMKYMVQSVPEIYNDMRWCSLITLDLDMAW